MDVTKPKGITSARPHRISCAFYCENEKGIHYVLFKKEGSEHFNLPSTITDDADSYSNVFAIARHFLNDIHLKFTLSITQNLEPLQKGPDTQAE